MDDKELQDAILEYIQTMLNSSALKPNKIERIWAAIEEYNAYYKAEYDQKSAKSTLGLIIGKTLVKW